MPWRCSIRSEPLLFERALPGGRDGFVHLRRIAAEADRADHSLNRLFGEAGGPAIPQGCGRVSWASKNARRRAFSSAGISARPT